MFALFSKHLSSSWMQYYDNYILCAIITCYHFTTPTYSKLLYTIERCRLNPVDDDRICMQLRCRLCMGFKGLILRTDF